MFATVIFVATLVQSSIANAPSGPSGHIGSQSYGGYNQHQQLQQQQYQPQQQNQHDRWYNEVNQASYQKDNGYTQEVTQSSEPKPDVTNPPEDEEPPPLPEGWSEHFDPNSGQYYYYNSVDGTTSWDRPLPPDTPEQGAVEGESKGEDSQPAQPEPENTGATQAVLNPTPEQNRIENTIDVAPVGTNGMADQDGMPDSSPEAERWQSSNVPQSKQQVSNEPSGIQQEQPASWEGQGQNGRPQVNEWGSPQPVQAVQGRFDGNNWGQSNSTESSVVRGEPEVQKNERQGHPSQIQHPGQPNGWVSAQQTKAEDSPSRPPELWGVARTPEQRTQHYVDPQRQYKHPMPSSETSAPPNVMSSEKTPSGERLGMAKPTVNTPPIDGPQNPNSPPPQRSSWQEQNPPNGNQQTTNPPQRSLVHQGPPHANKIPPQHQPGRVPYMQRQYPPQSQGQYNPNAPPGQGQYDPKYGGQTYYGRGYPPQTQPSTGQLVSQGTEAGTSAVKEALSTTWKGLLGWSNRTREVVGTARDQVVTGATAAGQTLSARSSSMWETAKTTVGGVFEPNEADARSPYSLSGVSGQSPPDNRPPPNFQGRPTGPNQGYPNSPGGPGGRGPPPRNFGGQQSGRYGPPHGQQHPPYGGPPNRGPGEPNGRRQPPPHHQHQKPQGYPNVQPRREHPQTQNMQPRRDHPYPQMQKGQERGPMQSQYGNQAGVQPLAQGSYPHQQRPPYSGPPGAQPNRGPGAAQGIARQENDQDPWDHPGLTGDY